MNSKLIVKVFAFLTAGLAAASAASFVARKSLSASGRQERQLVIAVEQLPAENGSFPVEMRCGAARSSAPNKLDDFSCLVINNTSKKIAALAMVYTVVVGGLGGESKESNLISYDFAINPDIVEARRLKLLPPGESRTVQPPGPLTFEDAAVRGVEAHIDYVEFEDGTSTGADTSGSKMIKSMREGAARYKAWLVQQYKRNHMEGGAVAPLLESADIPKEMDGDDPNFAEGARLYKRIMRSVYTAQGASGLRRYLNR